MMILKNFIRSLLGPKIYLKLAHLKSSFFDFVFSQTSQDKKDGKTNPHQLYPKIREELLSPIHQLDDQERSRALQLSVLQACGSGVRGHIAEFGTMSGMSAVSIAKAIREVSVMLDEPERQLHLFDSFTGFPKINSSIDRVSPQVESGIWAEGSCLGISEEELVDRCAQFIDVEKIKTYNGFFSETIQFFPKDIQLSMINFDADLYQSTIDALDYLFTQKQISDGAIICFDDWNCNRASNKFGERKAWDELSKKHSIGWECLGYYAWSGRKIVVHNYKR